MPKISFAARVKAMVGGNSLAGDYYRFLLVHTEFMIFSALPGVFINTFLMKQTGNMDVVLIFNFLNFSGTAIGMLISSAVVHRFHAGVVSVLGIVGYNLLYLQLIVFGGRSANFVVLLGITSGIAGAFYWMSYSERLTQCTNLTNRDSGMAIISMISSAINLVVPFISGALISIVGGDAGYNVIFAIAFIIAIVTAVGAIRLPKPDFKTPHVHHTKSFRFSFQHKNLFFSLLSSFFMGIREGAFSFILSILLFRLISSEALVGFNTLLSSAAAIASFVIISRKINGENRIRYMKIAVLSLLIFSFFVIFKINPLILILFTILNSFFTGFISNSTFGIFLDIIQNTPEAQSMRPELFAQKEIFLATGRCLGILVILLIDHFNSDLTWQAISLAMLTFTQIGTIATSRYAMKLTDEILKHRSEP